MSDIPEDVMKKAWVVAVQLSDIHTYDQDNAETIARAIMAAQAEQREKDAKIADTVAEGCRHHAELALRRPQRMASSAQAFVVDRVAAAIRRGES